MSDLDAVLGLLARLGITPEQLAAAANASDKTTPTFRDYIAEVSDAVSPGTRRAYGPYWQRVIDMWGDRRIDEPTPLEIRQLSETVKANAVRRKNSRNGRAASEHLISALRCLYRYATADDLITEANNPALRVAKPRRLPSTSRAIPDARLAEIVTVVATTGNDPDLDSLILRLHTETACRRGGALGLRPCDLDPDQCLILLREKGETTRWQPVSPTLIRHLQAHVEERGTGDDDAQVLRYRSGRPITGRRYDHLWDRVGRHIPWVARQQVTIHWLRHTTLTWVERRYGYAVAHAYAGHTDGGSHNGSTNTYIGADIGEVAAALAALTGEPHPLATPAS